MSVCMLACMHAFICIYILYLSLRGGRFAKVLRLPPSNSIFKRVGILRAQSDRMQPNPVKTSVKLRMWQKPKK